MELYIFKLILTFERWLYGLQAEASGGKTVHDWLLWKRVHTTKKGDLVDNKSKRIYVSN